MSDFGIGITTLNRREMFNHMLRQTISLTPADVPIVVVDDGSDVAVPSDSRITVIHNTKPHGIARAKNQCIAALMANPGVQHMFLFDDDAWPTESNWYEPYINSKEHHLSLQLTWEEDCATCRKRTQWNYNTVRGYPTCNVCYPAQEVYRDDAIHAVQWGSGVMMFFTRHAVETVGGFRREFGRYGCEHWDIAYRCVNAGLTQYPFQDIHDPKIHAVDAHSRGIRSCVPQSERRATADANWKIFEKYKETSDFVPYIEERPVATVCIPWRSTPDRVAAHDYCTKYWADNGFTVIDADSIKSQPFLCGQARNNAVRKAKTDIVIIADGDTVPQDIDQIYEAIAIVDAEPGCVVWPFTVYRHIPAASMELPDLGRSPVDNEYRHGSPGGIIVVNRQTLWSIYGFDERFVPGAWGFDDTSFMLAANTLTKTTRVEGIVYSFNHSVDSSGVDGRDLSDANPNKARYKLYEFASHAGAAVMRELVKDPSFKTK